MNSQLQELSKEADKVIDEFLTNKIEQEYNISFDVKENKIVKYSAREAGVLLYFNEGQVLYVSNKDIERLSCGQIAVLLLYTYEDIINEI